MILYCRNKHEEITTVTVDYNREKYTITINYDGEIDLKVLGQEGGDKE